MRVKAGLRRESTGKEFDATMLCCSPSAWPISCVITWRIVSPISSSGMSSVRAPGFAAPVSIISRLRYERMWLWYQVISLFRISPVRGSEVCGPTALRTRLAAHRTHAAPRGGAWVGGGGGIKEGVVGFHRFDDLAAGVRRRVPGLETPARDERL